MGYSTCLREIGKVNLLETSGTLTISLTISRQFLHTPAQETTFFLDGQLSSDCSILIRTSLRSSGGILAQQLCLKASTGTEVSWTTRWDLDLPYPNPFRDILPSSPLMSWIRLLNDMALNTTNEQPLSSLYILLTHPILKDADFSRSLKNPHSRMNEISSQSQNVSKDLFHT